MTYHVRKRYYVTQAFVLAGWFLMITWAWFRRGADIELLWVAAGMPAILSAIVIYGLVKQSGVPVVQTDADEIKINNIFVGPQTLQWALVSGLKKYPLLGYKVEAVGNSVDKFGHHAKANPPGGELGEPAQGVSCKRYAVVGTDALG